MASIIDFCVCLRRPSKEGFDIVIGNPPYFKYEGSHKGEINALKKQPFLQIAFGGKLNAYKLFLALALKYLIKPNGIISYIFQNSFMGDLQAYNLRKAVICENQPLIIDSFPERDSKKKRVFESVKMSVCIVVIKATNTDNPFIVNFWDDKNKSSGTQTSFTRKDIIEIDTSSYTIPRIEKEHKSLVIKLKALHTLPLKCYEGEFNMTFHKKYFSKDKCNPKILKGASIQRYYITEKMSQGEIEYLNEKAYLEDNSGEKTGHHMFERVAMQGMTGANDKIRIIMSIVPAGFYLANSCNYLIPNLDIPAKYLVGLMNSKVINWFFRRFSTNSNVNGYEVESLPIPNATKQEKETIASKVDEILKIKGISVNADTKTIEKEIDHIVYKLFGLCQKEIEIVEG
jgi:type IIG restriction enzyme and methyltransferase